MKSKVIFLVAFLACTCFVSAQWKAVNNFNFHIQPGTLAALGDDTVIVAADNGNMHFSADGGNSFNKDSLPFPYSWYHDIHFPTKTTGYVCGGTAFGQVKSPIGKTTDGGQTWDSISGNQFGYELYSVFFLDENTGFFGGQNIIVKTTDGGQTFTVDSLLLSWQIIDIVFTDALTGFHLSSQNIYKTTDGGQSWNVVFTDTIPSFIPGFVRLDFVSSQVGFALGRVDGKLVKTTDGGNTWSYSITPPDTVPLVDFDFVDENIGYAISTLYQPTSEGRIYKTADGGQSWITQYIDTTQRFGRISMASEDVGYVLGDSTLLATTNGGVGLNEEILAPHFDVFPNPAFESFHIRSESDVKIEEVSLTDISGREVTNWNANSGTQSYSVSHIKPGVYVVGVKTSDGILQKKLVIY